MGTELAVLLHNPKWATPTFLEAVVAHADVLDHCTSLDSLRSLPAAGDEAAVASFFPSEVAVAVVGLASTCHSMPAMENGIQAASSVLGTHTVVDCQASLEAAVLGANEEVGVLAHGPGS